MPAYTKWATEVVMKLVLVHLLRAYVEPGLVPCILNLVNIWRQQESLKSPAVLTQGHIEQGAGWTTQLVQTL
jgi:hypothetical protein